MSWAERWEDERVSHWVSETLARAISEVLKGMVISGEGEALPFEPAAAPAGVWQLWDSPVWLTVEGGLGPEARIFVGCAGSTVDALAMYVMDGESVAHEEGVETFREVVNQAFSMLGDEATKQVGRKIEMPGSEAAEAPSGTAAPVELRFTLGGGSHAVTVAPNQAWIEALFADPEAESGASDSARDAAAQGAAETSVGLVSLPRNLERLLEVELDLAISFGETMLPLADVLKLSSGSIVELNRAVSDAVDLLVNDSIIARGEVVVVDGNYGIRVTEVASPKQRMESLL